MMALGAMKAATQLGIKMPQQLSIVGFDDLLFAEYTNPELTTIRRPQEDIGKTAANTLMKILQGSKASQDTIVPTQLLVRSSCCSPAK